MTTPPTPYENLLEEVLNTGTPSPDRTGTGTHSVFGRQLRYDLSQGFPLITTKKMFTRGMIAELLWFISGDTNEHTLRDKNVNFWREWARGDGGLGPVYGKQMRHRSSFLSVTPMLFDQDERPEFDGELVNGYGRLGEYDPSDPHHELLLATWLRMMSDCYEDENTSDHVDPSWHTYSVFQKEAKKLPGWVMKLEYPDEFDIDKNTKLASNRYSKLTCIWASENVRAANRDEVAVGTGLARGVLDRHEGVDLGAVQSVLDGSGFDGDQVFGVKYLQAVPGQVIRYNEVDQLRQLIASLKHDPYSRRHLITLWEPAEIDFSELPPCHGIVIQFYVSSGRLSCQIYQRSADLFLGVPVNIASYALFTHMIAQQVGLDVGELIWTGGDCHIYDNHREQVAEQISRQAYPYPRLELNKAPSIFEYSDSDVTIHGYEHHPVIKAPVAV